MSGDLAELEQLLARDVVLYGDGGGVRPSPSQPLHGAGPVAAFLVEIAVKRRATEPLDLELAAVNGQPGRVLRTQDGRVWDVLTIDVHDGQVHAVRIIRNPSKTTHLNRVTS